MANSYYLYQLYEKRGSQPFHPAYPVEYSVDGNGTMAKVMKMANDPNCDGVDPVRYQWVVVTGDYMCSGTTKCQKEKEQRSDDFGMTWRDTGRTRAGSPIEYNSVDCGYVPPQYRTVSGTPYCNGYTKMVDTWNEVSYDSGVTWSGTGVSGSVVIEYDSYDCGYPLPRYRWVPTDEPVCVEGGDPQYRTVSGTPYCEGYDLVVDTQEQISPDSGQTWHNYGDSAVTVVEYNSEDCGAIPLESQYLTFDIVSSGTIVWKTTTSNASNAKTINYSTDSGATWRSITATSAGTSFNVSAGDNVMFKGNNSQYNYNTFSGSTAAFNVRGNIMSLIGGDNFSNLRTLENGYVFYRLFCSTNVIESHVLSLPATTLSEACYRSLFEGCSSLTTVPTLPATTLAVDCYSRMFVGCTSLTTTPTLPAMTLANSCYANMFEGCTGLTVAPVLSATTLASSCYAYMFNGCSSLTTVPVLSATTMADYCYSRMFRGCTSLVTAPVLSATTLAVECCSYMFSGCTSITTAPSVLPATTLASGCYKSMFYGCTNLLTAPELPATTMVYQCYQYMFRDCARLTTAPVLSATTLAGACYSNMFEGCSSLTTAPELPAPTMADYCYFNMFYNCSSLNSITCLATDIASYSTQNWVYGVASSGTFTKSASMYDWREGTGGIPRGWTVQDAQ